MKKKVIKGDVVMVSKKKKKKVEEVIGGEEVEMSIYRERKEVWKEKEMNIRATKICYCGSEYLSFTKWRKRVHTFLEVSLGEFCWYAPARRE